MFNENETLKFEEIPANCKHMTIEEFMNRAINGEFTDEKGLAFHATKTRVTNKRFLIKEMLEPAYKRNFDFSFSCVGFLPNKL